MKWLAPVPNHSGQILMLAAKKRIADVSISTNNEVSTRVAYTVISSKGYQQFHKKEKMNMQNFLNLTLPLKQDPASQAKMPELLTTLESASSRIAATLKASGIVYFARFLLIGRPPQYLQVITTFDGDEDMYARFFFDNLKDIFTAAYEFVEEAPTGEDFTFEKFRDFNKRNQDTEVRLLFRFSAFENKTVKEINGLS